jgi:hypothetical protein
VGTVAIVASVLQLAVQALGLLVVAGAAALLNGDTAVRVVAGRAGIVPRGEGPMLGGVAAPTLFLNALCVRVVAVLALTVSLGRSGLDFLMAGVTRL